MRVKGALIFGTIPLLMPTIPCSGSSRSPGASMSPSSLSTKLKHRERYLGRFEGRLKRTKSGDIHARSVSEWNRVLPAGSGPAPVAQGPTHSVGEWRDA